MALSQLMGFDANAALGAFEKGKHSGLEQLQRTQRQQVGQVLASDGYDKAAKMAFGFGDLDGGSVLAGLYGKQREAEMQQQQAIMKQEREAKIAQAMSGAVDPDLGPLAQLDPRLAATIQAGRAKAQPAPFTLAPGTNRYDGQGNLIAAAPPKQGDKRISTTALKAKNEAEDANLNYDAALSTLNEAKSLLSPAQGQTNVLEGYGAGFRGDLAAKLPDAAVPDFIATPEQGKATAEYGRIMSLEAIKAMSDTLKGASTDKELFEFQRIMADPSIPNELKVNTLDRMMRQLEARKALTSRRATEMLNAEGQTDGYQGADGVTSQDQGGLGDGGAQYPQEAIDMLATDGSPEARAEFDAVFGEGAAARVLGQ